MSPFTVMAMDISCSYKRLFLWDSTFYKFGVFLVSGWWYTYLYEKYEFVSWDYEIPNWMETNHVPKPPTRINIIFNDIPIVSLISLIYHHSCLIKDMNPLYFTVKNHGITRAMAYFTPRTPKTPRVAQTWSARCHPEGPTERISDSPEDLYLAKTKKFI